MLQREGKKYLSANVNSLSRYSQRIARTQRSLLKRLAKHEKRLLHRLRHTDITAYAKALGKSPSFDSIRILAQLDTNAAYRKGYKAANSSVDSLQRIAAFLQNQPGLASTDVAGLSEYDQELQKLNRQLSTQQYTQALIGQRAGYLDGLLKETGNYGLMRGISKQWYYWREKVKVFRQMADEPERAEEEALEYLQGTKGFNEHMGTGEGPLEQSSGGGYNQALNAADLEKMGYQTKRQVSKQLQQQYGSTANGVQQVSNQVQNWQQQSKRIQNIADGTMKEGRSIRDAAAKPLFRKNPMRCLPFVKRVVKSWNFQTQRPSIDGNMPALTEIGFSAGYKQTPNLTYGIGVNSRIGLGKEPSNIKLSFEGVQFRAYLQWAWVAGIGGYCSLDSRLFNARHGEYGLDSFNTYNDDNAVLPSIGLFKKLPGSVGKSNSIILLMEIYGQDDNIKKRFYIRWTSDF